MKRLFMVAESRRHPSIRAYSSLHTYRSLMKFDISNIYLELQKISNISPRVPEVELYK